MHELEKARIVVHELELGCGLYIKEHILIVFFPGLLKVLDRFFRIFSIAIFVSSRKTALVALHQFGGPYQGGLQPGVRVDSGKFLLIVDPQVRVSRRAFFLRRFERLRTRPWSQKTRAISA